MENLIPVPPWQDRWLRELETLLWDADMEARLLPAEEELGLASLVVIAGEKRLHTISITMVPLDDMEFTCFLQFYTELPVDLSAGDEVELLRRMAELNRGIPVGGCFPAEPREDMPFRRMAGLRYLLALPAGEEPDEGVFVEGLYLYLASCDYAADFLEACLEDRETGSTGATS